MGIIGWPRNALVVLGTTNAFPLVVPNTTMFPLFFMLTYFSGGQNFEIEKKKKKNGNI